jgi:hypothetical protein
MPSGQPLDPRAPERPSLTSLQREQRRSRAQLDRRISGTAEPEFVVRYIGSDEPGRKRGRLWLRPRNPEA